MLPSLKVGFKKIYMRNMTNCQKSKCVHVCSSLSRLAMIVF